MSCHSRWMCCACQLHCCRVVCYVTLFCVTVAQAWERYGHTHNTVAGQAW
jgi:hypothetical protein